MNEPLCDDVMISQLNYLIKTWNLHVISICYNNTEWRHMFIIKKQDNSNYLNDLQQVGCVWQHDPRRGRE